MPGTPCHDAIIKNEKDNIFDKLKYHNPLGTRVRETIKSLNEEDIDTWKTITFMNSPWTYPIENLCKGIIGRPIKKDRTEQEVQQAFMHQKSECHNNQIVIYTDASKSIDLVG